MCIRSLPKESRGAGWGAGGGGGRGLLHMNINLNSTNIIITGYKIVASFFLLRFLQCIRGARWLSGRVSDSGARGPGFETYRRCVVSLSKTLYSPKVLVNYPGSDGSVPT